MGTLRHRGTIWWIRYCRNGKRYEESSGSSKKGVALDLLKVREGDVAHGVPVTPKMGRLRFEEAADDLIREYRTNGRKSLTHLEGRIRLALAPFFGGCRMAGILTADVQRYIERRQAAGAANATINRELSALKRMYRLAVQGRKLADRPHIPMLEEDNVRQGFFEPEQFAALRAHLPAELQPVITFAYVTGWRVRSELLPLTWAQVDRATGTVRLEPGTTKNKQARTFTYGKVTLLRDVMEEQWRARQALALRGVICPYVFHRDGARIRDLYGAWEKACRLAGCPGRIPHDLRRTAVRNLVRAGNPEGVAMKLTGHKTRAVFERYNIVSESDLGTAATRLDMLLTAGTGTKVGQSGQSGTGRA